MRKLKAVGMVLKVIRIAETTSTQDVAADYVKSLESEGLEIPLLSAVSADYQSAGRGRLGRRWEAKPGQSILLTVAVNVRGISAVAERLYGWFPLIGSQLMVQAIQESVCGADLAIGLKWPNDVLAGSKKLAGILATLLPSPQGVVLVGSGVNVLQSDPPYAGSTSLRLELEKCGADRDYPALKESIEKRYLELWAEMMEWLSYAVTEAPEEIVPKIHRRVSQALVSVGRRVRVEPPGRPAVTGSVQRLGRDGALVMRVVDQLTGQAREERIIAATVVHADERDGLRDLPPGHGTDEGEAAS